VCNPYKWKPVLFILLSLLKYYDNTILLLMFTFVQLHITGHRLHTGPVYLTQNSELDHNSTSTSDHPDQRQSPSVSTRSSTGRLPTRTIVGVEGYAIQHYSTEQGWPCALHAEGSSFTTIFALLMWSVIFASGVPNVFRTKFQASASTHVRTSKTLSI
jgi:hypothetical protein